MTDKKNERFLKIQEHNGKSFPVKENRSHIKRTLYKERKVERPHRKEQSSPG